MTPEPTAAERERGRVIASQMGEMYDVPRVIAQALAAHRITLTEPTPERIARLVSALSDNLYGIVAARLKAHDVETLAVVSRAALRALREEP